MRKSFTRLFSIFILSVVISLQGFAQTFPELGLSEDVEFTNLKTTDVVVLTADEAVEASTGVVRLKEGGATLTALQATSSKVTITVLEDGTSEIALDFTDLFEEQTTYSLEVDADFVKAVDNGDANEAVTGPLTVGDWTAPVLATDNPMDPKNGATSVELNANLTLDFNEEIDLVEGSAVFIYKDNGTAHGDLYDVVKANAVDHLRTKGVEMSGLFDGVNTLSIFPNKDFEELTKYYVVVPEGVVTDATGNANKFAGWVSPTTWVFTTRDATAPEVTKAVADNIAKDKFDVVLQLDKPGKVYVLAVEKEDPAPSAATVIGSGVSKEVAAASTDVTVSLDGFTEGASYDVYVVTENAEASDPTLSGATKEVTVTTADMTAPTVAAMYPADGEPEADVNKEDYLTLELSEDVKIGTGAVDVYTWDAETNHTLLVSVPVADCMVSMVDGTTENDSLYIPVDKSLWVSEGVYFVKYNEGIVTDLAGNKLAAEVTTEGWKFTVADFLAPTYTIEPTDGTTDASEEQPIVEITFNETVYEATGGTNLLTADEFKSLTIVVVKDEEGVAVDYTPTLVGNLLSLTLEAAKVTSNAAFEVTIDTKKIYDAAGNAGTTSDKVNFSIKDFEAPTVDVKPNTPAPSDNITVVFNEKVYNADGSEVTDADVAAIVIFRKGTTAAGAIVSATYSVAADGKSFIINPANDLADAADYFVKVGAGSLEDAEGNAIEVAYQEIIKVADVVAPTAEFSIAGTTPVDPNTAVMEFTFSEAMETLAGDAVVDADIATALVNFKEDGENFPFSANWDVTDVDAPKVVVTATLNAGKTYTIGIGKSLQDVAENPFAGISKTFQTWSDVAPAAVTYMPGKDATEQANDVAISVTFDQTITETGTVGDVTIEDSGLNLVTDVTTTVDGAVLKIAHADLVENETYTVTIPAGYLEGANAEPTAEVEWSFKTEDTTIPAVATYSPVGGGAAVDSKLVLTFSEKIVEKTGSIFIKDYDTDVTVMTLTEANAEVKDNTKLEVTPTAAFSYDTQYYVEVTGGLVEDVNGNPNAAVTGNTEWVFKTVLTPGAFTVKTSSPADEEDKVVAGLATITVDFNREIKAGSLSGTKLITLNDGTSDVITDVANSSRFSISGTTLTINALNDIVADKKYTLTLESGIVKDEWNQDNETATIVFYTKDVNAPKVASHTPVEDAEDVPVNTTITLNWDETPLHAADGSAITAADIKADGLVTVDGGTAYTAEINGTQWVLTMDANFTEKDVIPVVVKTTAIEDALGNTGTTDYDWSFTVEDKTCNAPTLFTVTENTAGTKIKFTVDFDEKGTVYYVVLPAADATPDAATIMAADVKIAFAGIGTSDAKEVTGLTSAADYKAHFVAVDAAGNESTTYSAPFTTADVIAPELVSMTPANEATGVAANTTLVLKFDEPLKPATFAGVVIVREVATDIIVATINVDGNTTLSADYKTATIATAVTLGNETAYYVEVSAGAFVDVAGNAWAGISGADKWSFTTKDTVAPELEKTYPDYDAAELPEITADKTLWIEFNEAMKNPEGVVYVKYAATNTVFEVVNKSAITLSDDKKTMSFNLTNVPVEETEFYVDLSEAILKDEADNAWSNIFEDETAADWDFIILDETAPALASSDPANNETGVAIDQVITLTFTEGILSADGKEFNGTDAKIEDVVTLKDDANNTVDATIEIIGGNVVKVTPDEDLNSEANYTVYVSPVTDDRENLSDEITVTFTTKDMTAPTVEMWDPEYDTTFNPKTGVVTVTFTEAIYDEAIETTEGNIVTVDILDEHIVDFFTYKVVTTVNRDADKKITSVVTSDDVAFTGTISADRKVITLTPAEDELPLVSEGWYQVVLLAGVVEDIASNENVTSQTVFQVEDHVKPTVTAYSPVGAIEKDGDLTITFDENVAVGTGMVYIRNYVNGEVVATVDVTAADQVTVEDNVVTINPTDDLPEAMSFFITADAGTFVDASANANEWEGIATDAIDTWNVSTDDAVAPGVIAENGLFPAPEATNVPTNTDITITFDKKVKLNDDDETRWVIIYNEDWTPYQVIEVNEANIDLEPVTDPILDMDRIVSIKHMELEASSTYYVRVMKGSVTDVAGNLFAGIMDDSWSFTTEDNSAPAIVALTPADDSEAVDASADLVIEFDRNVLANAAGMIKVYKEMPGEELGVLVMTVDPTSEMVSIVDNIATINLPENLEFNTGYYVIVDAGSFTNTSTSKMPLEEGITTTQGWNFTTGDDMVAPVVVELSPDEETLEDNHPVFIMTFDENVQLTETGGSIHVTLAGEETAVLDIPLTADMIVDNVITIEYEYNAETGGLDKNADYFVTVDADAIQDMTGNAFAGISDAAEWTFTTGADFATGVEDPVDGSLEFKVYPNPFDSYVTVKNADKLSRVIITNVAGQRVKDIANPTETIQTGDLRSGLYIITLVTKDDVVAKTERIVKR